MSQWLLIYELLPIISPFYCLFFLPLPDMHSFNKNLFLYVINNNNIYWVLISCESNIVFTYQWNMGQILDPSRATAWWGRERNANINVLLSLVYQGRLHSRGDHFAGSQRMDKSSLDRQGRETSTGRGNSMSIDRGVLFISTLFCSNRTSPSTPKFESLNKKKHTIYSYTMHEVNTVALVFGLTSKHATEVLSQLLFWWGCWVFKIAHQF